VLPLAWNWGTEGKRKKDFSKKKPLSLVSVNILRFT
jgi:hypothetical protein